MRLCKKHGRESGVMRIFSHYQIQNKMYNEPLSQPLSKPLSQPEHKETAMDFANVMLERFNPNECNEMLALIRQRWSEYRQMEIEKAEKQISYLKESLSVL